MENKIVNERIKELERREVLKAKINMIIHNNFDKKLIEDIKPYVENITNYIIENGNTDIVYNNSELEYYIKTYYKYITTYLVPFKDMVKLQSLSRTTDTNIAYSIKVKYNFAKERIAYGITKRFNIDSEDHSAINDIIPTILEQYENGQLNLDEYRLKEDEAYLAYYNNYKNASQEEKDRIIKEWNIDSFEEFKTKTHFEDAIKTMKFIKENTNLDDLNPLLTNDSYVLSL